MLSQSEVSQSETFSKGMVLFNSFFNSPTNQCYRRVRNTFLFKLLTGLALCLGVLRIQRYSVFQFGTERCRGHHNYFCSPEALNKKAF